MSSSSIWKPIKGYEGMYEVNTFGHVCSLTRVIKNGLKSTRVIKGKSLKLKIDRNGYPTVTLNKEHKAKTVRVHRLVAEAFLRKPHNYTDVNHIDGVKTNNSVYNLEYCTRSQNIEHAYKNQLRTDAKFNPQQIRDIRTSESSQRALAREYNVDRNTIKQIKTKRTYKWVN